MKPTILFLEQQSWRAGAQRVLDSVLDALVDEYDLLVAFPDFGPYAEDLRRRGVETIQYPLGRYRPGKKSYAEKVSFAVRSVKCAFQIARLTKDRNISLIYINAPRSLPAGALAAYLTQTPAIFHLHRTLTDKTDLFVVSKAAAYVRQIIACSRAAAAALSAAAPRLASRIQVVYNPASRAGTPAGLFSIPLDSAAPDRKVMGLVGRITPQKGHMTLLQAVSRFKGDLSDVEVVFVGAPEDGSPVDAAYLEHLRAAVRDLGLESRVRFVGYQADPGPFYRQFDLLAAPSLESEGLPMAVLEAASWGVPAVGSNVAGMAEVISEGMTGLLVAPQDIDAWVRALGTVLRNSDLRRQMGDAARRMAAQRFSPESFRGHIRRIVQETRSTAAGDPSFLGLAERPRPTKA